MRFGHRFFRSDFVMYDLTENCWMRLGHRFFRSDLVMYDFTKNCRMRYGQRSVGSNRAAWSAWAISCNPSDDRDHGFWAA